MKKILGFLIIISSFFIVSLNVYAEEDTKCNYKSKAELSKAAFNADANYSIRTDENGNYYFEISLYNITDQIYAVVTNNINDEEILVYNNITTNNNYKFEVHDTTTVINYVVHIRATKYGCSDEFRKINISKPRYNDISELAVCKNDNMLDYTYCKPWVNRYFTETREEVLEKVNNQFAKNKITTTTACITCEQKDEVALKIKKQKMIKIAIIVGLFIGIILDIGVITLLIIRLKRYDI